MINKKLSLYEILLGIALIYFILFYDSVLYKYVIFPINKYFGGLNNDSFYLHISLFNLFISLFFLIKRNNLENNYIKIPLFLFLSYICFENAAMVFIVVLAGGKL
ncbi:MAG: hypothetical protein JWQ14_1158 [Adhaeribacter sp.]|nr:hypothetical protein [Adhaeribacter sp.]